MNYVNYIGVDVRFKNDGDIAYSAIPPPKYDYKTTIEPEYIPQKQEWYFETLSGYKMYINKNEIVFIRWYVECVENSEDSEIRKSQLNN